MSNFERNGTNEGSPFVGVFFQLADVVSFGWLEKPEKNSEKMSEVTWCVCRCARSGRMSIWLDVWMTRVEEIPFCGKWRA